MATTTAATTHFARIYVCFKYTVKTTVYEEWQKPVHDKLGTNKHAWANKASVPVSYFIHYLLIR